MLKNLNFPTGYAIVVGFILVVMTSALKTALGYELPRLVSNVLYIIGTIMILYSLIIVFSKR